jgi:hypothetical protein
VGTSDWGWELGGSTRAEGHDWLSALLCFRYQERAMYQFVDPARLFK